MTTEELRQAVRLVAENYDPHQPRVPGGRPTGGEFLGYGTTGAGGKWAHPQGHTPAQTPAVESKSPAAGQGPEAAPTFTSKEERRAASEYAKTTHGDWGKKLTSGQKDALEKYGDEDSYEEINGGLRAGKIPEKYAETVKQMDSAIQSAPPTKVAMTLYRGVGVNMAGSLKPGVVFQDHGYTSTSHNEYVGKKFARGVLIEVKAPPGSRMASMDASGKAQVTGDLSEIGRAHV